MTPDIAPLVDSLDWHLLSYEEGIPAVAQTAAQWVVTGPLPSLDEETQWRDLGRSLHFVAEQILDCAPSIDHAVEVVAFIAFRASNLLSRLMDEPVQQLDITDLSLSAAVINAHNQQIEKRRVPLRSQTMEALSPARSRTATVEDIADLIATFRFFTSLLAEHTGQCERSLASAALA